MSQDLRDKLRRLGVVKGARNLKPATRPPAAKRPFPPEPIELPANPDPEEAIQPLESLLPGGRLETTVDGECYIFDKVFPLTAFHGDDRLQDLLQFSPETAVAFTGDSRLAELSFRDFLFLDTETTGLAGAGTIAFMVGVAFFEGEALVTRQFFLRDHGDEPAMLLLLEALLAQKKGLITFNGRSFDIPLLDTRYLMNRMMNDLRQMPHLDLLPPARRLWRVRLGSCALGSLEENLLGVPRTQADVPGWMIPGLYNQYIRTGDARELVRVFYHNEIDLVSMVTLTARMMQLWQQATPETNPIDLFSLGKWQLDLGLGASGEKHLAWATQGDLPLPLYHQALHCWGAWLKRQDRRQEAVPLWQQIATTTFEDVTAHVELAKYYEWHEKDLATAQQWTEQAIGLTQIWTGQATKREAVEAELRHRLNRLQRKLADG